MKTAWDYSDLADAYLKRPAYSERTIDEMLTLAGVSAEAQVCDVGAGTAHLALPLAQRGFRVTAVEPNDSMRANGMKRLAAFTNVTWVEATGESTGQPAKTFALVTFGSSFNVCDRPAALREAARILKPQGWFACMWNHRNLDNPTQSAVEAIICKHIDNYDYGTRREDQAEVIDASGLFGPVQKIEGEVVHRQSIADCVEAWRSHATLQRQAGASFQAIVNEIEGFLAGLGISEIEIPYTTRIWAARLR